MIGRDMYYYQPRRKKRRGGKLITFSILVVSVFVFLYILIFLSNAPKQQILAAHILSPVVTVVHEIAGQPPLNQVKIDSLISRELSGTHGTYSVAIENLKTGETYDYNASHIYNSASLYKLWIMASVYHEIENGGMDLGDTLTEDVPLLNERFQIATDDAELTDGTVTGSVSDLLTQMITVSANYPAMLLTLQVRLSSVEDFLADNGMLSSHVGINGELPTTTAGDVRLFLDKLYRGELGTAENTKEMLNLLKQQQLNNKIPKYMPNTVVVAHKTGELGSVSHDAGIVYTDKGDYIIVLMSDTDDPAAAEDHIARISRAFYDYYIAK